MDRVDPAVALLTVLDLDGKPHLLSEGGVLVVKPGGEIAFRYLSEVAGDHPAEAELIAAAAG